LNVCSPAAVKAQLGCYRPPAAFGRRRCRRPLAPGPGPTATRVGLWTTPRPGRPVGNPRVLLPNSSRSLRDRREGRKKQGHRLWQQDKRMTRPSCPLAALHFAPASSTRFPPQCPCHVKPTARQARVAARDPIIGCLRLAPCSHALRATAMVPARLLSLLPCRAPGSPFLFASWPVHTSPHVPPHFRSSSLRGNSSPFSCRRFVAILDA